MTGLKTRVERECGGIVHMLKHSLVRMLLICCLHYYLYYLYFKVIRVNTQIQRASCKGEGVDGGDSREEGGLGGNGTTKEVTQIWRARFVDGLES